MMFERLDRRFPVAAEVRSRWRVKTPLDLLAGQLGGYLTLFRFAGTEKRTQLGIGPHKIRTAIALEAATDAST